MRYGLIVAPTTLPDLRPAPGTLDSDLVRERLPQDDVGIEVVDVDPTVDVAEQIDGFFDAHPEGAEAILFYASTFVALSPEGEVFLCLDPTAPDVGDSLRDIAAVIRERHEGPLLFVLDCRHAPDEEDPLRSATIAAAVRSALDPASTGIELLVAAQGAPPVFEDAVSPFTRAFLAELDEGDPARVLLAGDVYRRIHGSERLLGVVPCFAFSRGREPFVMIRGDGSGRAASIVDSVEAMSGRTELGSQPDSAERAARSEPEPRSEPATAAPVAATPVAEAAASATESASVQVAATEGTATVEESAPAPEREGSVDVDLDEPPPHAIAEELPPAAEPVVPEEPPAALPRPPAVPSVAIGTGERAAATATVIISDRPPPPADPGSLPKIVISDRPPPMRTPSQPAPAPSEPRADESSPRGSVRPAAAHEGEAAADAASTAAPAPAAEVEAPAEPEPPKEPTYADHVAAGDALASRDAEAALGEYKKALLLVTPAQKEERADVYVRIGQVKLLQDKRREAISNFEKATQLSPSHRGALEEIAKLSVEERDWRGVAATEEKILAAIAAPEDRFARLLEFGERWASVAFDTDRARSAFSRAREIKPDDLDVLSKLLRIHDATGAAEEAFALRKEIADKTPDPRARAEQYEALGKRCLDDLKDEDEALAFFEKALDADPKMLEPLATAATVLAERQEWSELEATYRRMLDRTERIAEADIRRRLRCELNRRLALLFRDHLEDPEDALAAFESAIADQPDDPLTRQNAITLARQLGKWDVARVHLQVLARLDPMVVQTYHDLFDVFQKLKRADQAWAAASVTAQLGHADERERFIYEEGKPDGPPKPTRALGPEAWDLLRDSGRDHAVEDVMEAIAKAAIDAKIADLRAQGRLPQLDPAARQDPKKSTVSIVRSFAWASHLLGVPMPDVYLRDDAQVGLAAVVAEEPSVIAGAGVLRGKTLAELAFAAGRHLAYHFGSHRLLLYYPVIDDLAACFLAAVRIVMPNASVPSRMEKMAAAMQGRIEPLLSAPARAALDRAVLAFEAAGSRADLNGWVASVERCSTRAGYLLTSDLRTAATSLGAEGAGVLTVEQKMVDLLWFTVSEELFELRDALGIAIEP